MQQCSNAQQTRLIQGCLSPYVLSQGLHNLVLKLLAKVFRADLLTDLADSGQRGQPNGHLLMAGILAQVGDQLGPFVPRDLDRGNGSDKSGDLVAQTRLFSGKRA